MQVFIFDDETTGLIRNHVLPLDRQPEIIEFYGANVDLAKGKVLSEVEFLIKPSQYPMSDYTIRETKSRISNEMLEHCELFSTCAPAIRKYIEAAPVVLAHNASFDQEMVDLEFERLGQKLKWPHLVCTVEHTVHLKGARLSLTALHELLFGEKFPNAHRAKADTQALIRVAIELYKRDLL